MKQTDNNSRTFQNEPLTDRENARLILKETGLQKNRTKLRQNAKTGIKCGKVCILESSISATESSSELSVYKNQRKLYL